VYGLEPRGVSACRVRIGATFQGPLLHGLSTECQ